MGRQRCRTKLWAAPLVTVVYLQTPQAWAEASAADSMVSFQLVNGLRVRLQPLAGAKVVGLAVGYATGNAHDPPAYRGLAHLAEHLTFRGSRHVNALEATAILERSGASYNAFTASEDTVYYSSAAKSQLPTLLWLEAERMAFAIEGVTAEALATEKRIVKNELFERESSTLFTNTRWRSLYGSSHPLAPPKGESNLDSVSLGGVQWFMQSVYRPENATLSVVGDFPIVETRELIERYFSAIRGHHAPQLGPAPPPPKRCGPRRLTLGHPFLLSRQLSFDWIIPDALLADRGILMSAFAEVLEERLRQELQRRTSLVASVFVGLDVSRTHGILSIGLKLLEPIPWEPVEKRVLSQVAQLARQSLTQDELKDLRARLLSELLLAEETPVNLAIALTDPQAISLAARREAVNRLDVQTVVTAARGLSNHYLVSRWEPRRGAGRHGDVLFESPACP